MCNIKKFSKEKDDLFEKIDKVSTISGAAILNSQRDMNRIEKRANENIRKLSLLL